MANNESPLPPRFPAPLQPGFHVCHPHPHFSTTQRTGKRRVHVTHRSAELTTKPPAPGRAFAPAVPARKPASPWLSARRGRYLPDMRTQLAYPMSGQTLRETLHLTGEETTSVPEAHMATMNLQEQWRTGTRPPPPLLASLSPPPLVWSLNIANASATIRCGSHPTPIFVPCVTVTGRSVFSRSVRQGLP